MARTKRTLPTDLRVAMQRGTRSTNARRVFSNKEKLAFIRKSVKCSLPRAAFERAEGLPASSIVKWKVVQRALAAADPASLSAKGSRKQAPGAGAAAVVDNPAAMERIPSECADDPGQGPQHRKTAWRSRVRGDPWVVGITSVFATG